MTDLKYEYLFNIDGKLTHHSEAIRLNEYSLYPGESLDYIYKEGDQRQYFAIKKVSNNPFEEITLKKVGGESIEHYNAKMKIAYEKKYFDTIFQQWIEFDSVIAEKQQEGNKRPDLSCYDSNGNLILCIEIYFTNSKSLEDIEKLKNIKVPIVEIDINYDNRCKHIILTEVLESNRSKFEEIEREIKFEETRYRQLAEQLSPGTNKIIKRIENIEREFKEQSAVRLSKINNWLQIRKPRNITKQSTFSEVESSKKIRSNFSLEQINNWLQERINRIEGEPNSLDKIKTTEREIKKIKANGEKTDYRIGKLESEINRTENNLRERRKSFKEIASKSKIKWFRNSWMTDKSYDLVNEIKYWLS